MTSVSSKYFHHALSTIGNSRGMIAVFLLPASDTTASAVVYSKGHR